MTTHIVLRLTAELPFNFDSMEIMGLIAGHLRDAENAINSEIATAIDGDEAAKKALETAKVTLTQHTADIGQAAGVGEAVGSLTTTVAPAVNHVAPAAPRAPRKPRTPRSTTETPPAEPAPTTAGDPVPTNTLPGVSPVTDVTVAAPQTPTPAADAKAGPAWLNPATADPGAIPAFLRRNPDNTPVQAPTAQQGAVS